MNRFLGFAVSVVAVGLLFSCTSDLESAESSSSAVQGISSSSSSLGSQNGVVYGTPVTYEGQTYQTVVIGSQTWFAENLNYAPSSGTFISCNTYDCATYGRLYDWSTAMALPSSCNSNSCSSQIQSPHRGICPSGWHIPSSEDWGKLSRYVDGTSGTNAGYVSTTAGKYLKNTSGWNSNGNGTNDYGFSALPGGDGLSGGSFYDVGNFGHWWSASEGLSDDAYTRNMSYNNDNANWHYYNKGSLFSVRCVQD